MSAERVPLWIFGYGSLVWRPDFVHELHAPARVHGWERRFWQGSIDHRGVPGAPGRVVTVLRDARAECWGRAFRIAVADEADVLAQLDHRERGGYERFEVEIELMGAAAGPGRGSAAVGDRARAWMYSATEDNPGYLGPAAADAIAQQVCASRGPSGHNVDYVLELARALRAMGAHDDHVFAVEAQVRARAENGVAEDGAAEAEATCRTR